MMRKIVPANRLLVDCFGDFPADKIDAHHLLTVRSAMVEAGHTRGSINARTQIIRRMFRDAAFNAYGMTTSFAVARPSLPGRLTPNASQPVDMLAVVVSAYRSPGLADGLWFTDPAPQAARASAAA